MSSFRWSKDHAVARSTITVALLAFTTACVSEQSATAPMADESAVLPQVAARIQAGPPQFVAGEMIVKFRSGATTVSRAGSLRAARASARERIVTAMMRRRGDTQGVEVLNTDMDVESALAAMRSNPDVEYAEPNWIYQHEAVSNDPYVTSGQLWGMNTGFGSQAVTAWGNNKTNCSGVYVGIIDEGYMYTHADLAANAGTNPCEIAGNGVDDDGNGSSTTCTAGTSTATTPPSSTAAPTTTARTSPARSAPSAATAPVSPACAGAVKLLSAKFLGRTRRHHRERDQGDRLLHRPEERHGLNIVATNNSWGGGGFSQALQDAIERANAADILFVAAAGNSTAST